MNSSINLIAIFVADFIGVIMLLLIMFTRGWIIPSRKKESRLMFALIIATLIDCLVDPFAFFSDGKVGLANYRISFFCNSFLYLYNLIVGTGVLFLVTIHINKKISTVQKIVASVIFLIEFLLLVINYFKPIIFYIDENNVYTRLDGYFLYIAFGLFLVFYGLIIYVIARIRDGALRYFPVWEFLLPIIICIFIQTNYYGISIQPVGFVISFTAIIISIQHESLYIDKLTGAYNRYELDKIILDYKKRRNRKFAAIMLDLNDFKMINDTYSHSEGDHALITLVNIVSNIIQNDGVVIRFAGDEFIIIINKASDGTVEEYSDKIMTAIEEYNNASDKPYKLSSAIGGEIFDMSKDYDIDFMKRIDELMYKNKSEYYKTHERHGVRN
ncbi:MAG: GGDEF domain-containing protein [Lachnospiraceae bacterium]|nr:GGDEF domain-containing protein [Lachnospiraceae bacterium]